MRGARPRAAADAAPVSCFVPQPCQPGNRAGSGAVLQPPAGAARPAATRLQAGRRGDAPEGAAAPSHTPRCDVTPGPRVTQLQRAGSACRQDGGAELGGGGEAGVPEGAACALLPALPAGAAGAVLVSGDQQVVLGAAPSCAHARAGLSASAAGRRSRRGAGLEEPGAAPHPARGKRAAGRAR